MTSIPVQRLHHANVVVNDARATAQNYARLLGISRWEVRHWTPQRLVGSQAYGYSTEFGYTAATGRNTNGVTFRLVQPTHGFSTFTEYLITRGEGVHSLCTTTLAASELESLLSRFEHEHGLTVAQGTHEVDGHATVLFDTREALGGFFVEVDTSSATPVAADEIWDFSEDNQRPDGVGWLAQLPRVGHFGVAVSRLTDRLPAYARLLDVSRWNGVHFHNTPDGLEHATIDGAVVDNAWLLAITDVADFGLELLQGTREPTDYQRTIQRIGEGIHHVLVRRGATDAEWSAIRDWMSSMQIGVVMSGRVRRGAGEFFYLDTRAALGGYLLEVIVAREVPDAPTPAAANWRFNFDFTNKV
jgi:Glyoxalase/Bleomycin resistance protein/Dioxygenase superfamily